jgi:hypothetical protein
MFLKQKVFRAHRLQNLICHQQNQDGMITMKEFKEYVKGTVPKSLGPRVFPPAGLAIVG